MQSMYQPCLKCFSFHVGLAILAQNTIVNSLSSLPVTINSTSWPRGHSSGQIKKGFLSWVFQIGTRRKDSFLVTKHLACLVEKAHLQPEGQSQSAEGSKHENWVGRERTCESPDGIKSLDPVILEASLTPAFSSFWSHEPISSPFGLRPFEMEFCHSQPRILSWGHGKYVPSQPSS